MNDITLSGLISLFALFGKEEQVDEQRARDLLADYLRRHFGIRKVDQYLDLYSDMRLAYESADGLSPQATVVDICSTLHGKIRPVEESLLLLRLMEFCGADGQQFSSLFRTMATELSISDEQYDCFVDFVLARRSRHVILHETDAFSGMLKTLLDPVSGLLIFTYTGSDAVLLNDVPVLSGAFQVWQQSSVLKGQNSGKPLYYSTIISAYGKAAGCHLTAANVEFCGRDINFRFPGSDNGIHNLSFTLHSGELLAVMGGSGTGKTTLLSLLNGTLQPQQGRITINGHDIAEPAAKSLIGFVPQDDLLIEELTVYQNLWYTAKLCFEGMAADELDRRVTTMLHDLGLYQVKDLKVGSAIRKFISGGQRKRLNIALELIREPAVLFLDEPTSGLSSADTERVVNLLKEQTLKGKLIVAIIHQPSSDVYKLFDRLWLLDRGGYPVFDGNPIEAITYFKEAANYADAETSACPTCGNVNPEIVLNILDEKALLSTGEPSEERKMSPQDWHELYLKRRPALPAPTVDDVPRSDQHQPGRLKQMAIFLRRNVSAKLTNGQYLAIALLEAPLLALICALLTRYAPPEGYSVMANKNLVSYFFMAIIVATFIGMSGSAEEIIKDRALLKREQFLHLSYASYIWSKIIFMAGMVLLQTLLFILVGNTIMGLHDLFATWWIILGLTAFLAGLTGLLLSQCLSSVVAIYVSIPILLIPQILLCGLVVSFSDLTPGSKTGNVPLIGDLIPSRWAYEALAVSAFTDNDYEAPFFELDRRKQEAQFYNVAFLGQLQAQLETMRDEQRRGDKVDPAHMAIVRTNMPRLMAYCGLDYDAEADGYESLQASMQQAERVLARRCNEATLAADRMMSALVRRHGKEHIQALKRAHCNTKLEDIVTGADQPRMVDVVDGTIVARTAAVFLTPQSSIGRAPFYSSRKMVGSTPVKTLWFNTAVMLLMAAVATGLLLADMPGRVMRK